MAPSAPLRRSQQNGTIGESIAGREGVLLRRDAEHAFTLHTADELRRLFEPSHEDGRCRLAQIRDQNDQRVTLTYEGADLLLVATAAHRIVVAHGHAGHISGLTVEPLGGGPRIAAARYVHDEHGDLVLCADAEGNEWIYRYGEDHLLQQTSDPTGRVFSFVYDSVGRCVETWGEMHGSADAGLAADIPEMLADGITRAKGFLHCRFEYHPDGYSEVADSVQVQRFFGNAFGSIDKAISGPGVTVREVDALGFEIARTDPEQRTTTWKRDGRGRILEEVKSPGPANQLRARRRGPGGEERGPQRRRDSLRARWPRQTWWASATRAAPP